MKNLELQKQEPMLLRIGDISDLDTENLKQELRYGMILIGLRESNLPTPIETKVIIDFIKKNYPQFRTTEIRDAFDLAVAGKLDVSANCYENFSCLYISQILNSYKRYMFNHREEKEDYSIKQIENRKTDSIMNEWISNLKNWIKEGTMIWELMPIDVYDYLKKEDKIKTSNEILKKAAIIHKQELAENKSFNYSKYKSELEKNIIIGDELPKVINIAKKLSLYEYLKK